MVNYNSKLYWRAYVNETNYAGGDAGAAYAETEPANVAALTSDNTPMNVEQAYPDQEYLQPTERPAGLAGDVVQTFTTGILIKPAKKIQWVQNSTWIDKMVAYKDNEAALPVGSWCEVFETGTGTYAAYGGFMTTYILSIPEGNAAKPQEEIDYKYYSSKTATAGNFTSKAWDTTTPKIKKDFTLTVDSVDYKFKTLTLTIVALFEEDPGSSQYQNKYPYFIGYESIEIEFTTREYDSDHMLDFKAEAFDPCTITIAGWGKTLTLNNMKPKNDTMNVFVQPESGNKMYSGIFEMGGDTNPSTA